MELVVVMLLLAILSAVAVPSLRGLSQARSDWATVRVQSALVYAQEHSLGTGWNTWVEFDTANDVIRLYAEDPASPGRANRVALDSPITLDPYEIDLLELDEGIDTAAFGATGELAFDGEGTPHDGTGTALTSDGLLTLDSGNALRVTAETGLIRIE